MVNACIKITRGGCGIKYTDAKGNPRHALKKPEDGPFNCDAAQAERLVALGVAEYVAKPDDEDDGAVSSVPKIGHLCAEDLEAMDYNDIKKLAAEMGVKPKGKTKADYIAALVAVAVDASPADDEEEPPALGAVDPE